MIALLLLLVPALAADPDTGWLPDAYSQGQTAAPSSAPWWLSFDQPVLTATIERGLGANPDLGALAAVTRQQQALAAQGLAILLPDLSFDVQGQLAPYDSLGFGFGFSSGALNPDPPDVYGTGSAKLNATLVVDLWGRSLTSWRASRLDALAAAGDADATALLMSTTIAGAWLDVATAARQVALVEEQAQVAGGLLEVVRLRYQGGAATALDVLQQEQSVAALQAQLPITRAQHQTARQRLAVLLGMDPTGTLPPGAEALPELPAAPAVGSPADLVDTRPDVRAAMTRAESAGARRSAALRGLLPTLALTGSAGWQATWIDDWTDQDTWTAGASLSVPLFNGGATHNAIRAGSAGRDAALFQLESTLRGAVQEVEAALVTEAAQQERRQAATRQRERAEAAWSVAHDGYAAGTLDYLQVQSALGTLLTARLTELSAHRDLLSARLQLHLALGGTWTRDLSSLSSSSSSLTAGAR